MRPPLTITKNENVAKVVEKAVKLGATPQAPVMDMFWDDHCGPIVSQDGYRWMVGTHKAEPIARNNEDSNSGDDGAAGDHGAGSPGCPNS